MAGLKLNLITIGLCFIFASIFHSKCDDAVGIQSGPELENNASTTPIPQILEPNCNAMPSTLPPFISDIQFIGVLLISVFALICMMYFLYLKTVEIKSKLCPCNVQQMNQPEIRSGRDRSFTRTSQFSEKERVYESPEILKGRPYPQEQPAPEYEELRNFQGPSASKDENFNFEHLPSSNTSENQILNSKIFHKKKFNDRF
ncbi:uncharacterized protein LOC135840780 [Planococcus citri]|uniref:uncharacterized protein LOC135840780 n=1 Tax=Planococcus citri TaxID=170843 RepID=UPI0031F7D411